MKKYHLFNFGFWFANKELKTCCFGKIQVINIKE